ncbi:MAG: transcription repressor NadR [Lachnospiraceae bacterium]
MSGEERRSKILKYISESAEPVSATLLAGECGVSRQAVVQDIALLRALGHNIISTHRGYVMEKMSRHVRIFKVRHSDEELVAELYSIVDLGGMVEDVFINHKAYGRVQAPLNINSRRKADELMEMIRSGKSSPLKNITSDYHYHTVTADSEGILDEIGEKLKELGFLIEK